MKLFPKIRGLLRRRWDGLWTTTGAGVIRVGGASSWAIKSDLLFSEAVVVSGGAGKDVSFEKELAERFGCRVYLFDPSPTGLETMTHVDNRHERIEFFPLGLAACSGVRKFDLPKNPAEGSYTLPKAEVGTGATQFQCTTLSEFAKAKNIKRIDVLKLDIEGFEYGVLDDALGTGIPITQVCVEFHHFMPGIGIHQTLQCIWRLRQSGFVLIHKEMCDYLFVAGSALR